MTRWPLRTLLLVVVLALGACGEEGIETAKNDPLYRGAELFNQRCSGCHTFDAAAAEGSANAANDSEYKDGPNFNERNEDYDSVLYAIRNGGFSSGPMPQNIVVGKDAEILACYVATYSGTDAPVIPTPGKDAASDSGPDDCINDYK